VVRRLLARYILRWLGLWAGHRLFARFAVAGMRRRFELT
jgi:hypothetical protein